MMQAAEPRHGNYLRTDWRSHLNLPASGSFLVQTEMSSIVMIVANVLIHQAFQMVFIDHDHLVEQIAAAAPHEAFGRTVLPRALKTGSFGLNAEALDRRNHLFIEMGPTIKDQVLRCGIIGKPFAELLRHPGARRMLRHVKVKYASPVMSDDEKAIKNTEVERWHCEEVHRCDDFTVVLQECLPSLRRLRISGRSSHPAQYRPLRNIEAQHLELAVNPRRTPGRVLGNHSEDQLAQFPAHAFSFRALAMPGKPSPIELKPSSMPANDSVRLNEDQSSLPSRPEASQHNPEKSVGIWKTWPWAMSREDQDLPPQSQVFQQKMMT